MQEQIGKNMKIKLRRVAWALGALALVNCSGEGDLERGETDHPGMSPLEEAQQLDFLGTEPLTEDEKQAINEVLNDNEMNTEEVLFSGRNVVVEGDILWHADELLVGVSDEVVSKAFVRSTTGFNSGFQDCTAGACGHFSPNIYARQSSSFEFKRPDTTRNYHLLVERPSGVSSSQVSNVVNFITAATRRIEDASSQDCLGRPLFQVSTRAQYENNVPSQPHYVILIQPYTYAMEDSGSPHCRRIACVNLPRLSGNGRMRFGNRMMFNVDAVAGMEADPVTMGVHELMHIMGLHHTDKAGDGDYLRVPGTTASDHPYEGNSSIAEARKGSVMEAALSDMHNWDCDVSGCNTSPYLGLPLEDRTILQTLYSGSCGYQSGWRTIN